MDQNAPDRNIDELAIDEDRVVVAIQECLANTGRVELTVFGTSMLPTVWPGARANVVSCLIEDVRPGDLVLIRRRKRLMLHRAIRREGEYLLVRGDAHARGELVGADRLLGRATHLLVGRWPLRSLPDRAVSPLRRLYLPVIPMARLADGMRRRVARGLERLPLARLDIHMLAPAEVASIPTRLRKVGLRPTAQRIASVEAAVLNDRGFAMVASRGGRLQAVAAVRAIGTRSTLTLITPPGARRRTVDHLRAACFEAAARRGLELTEVQLESAG